MHLHDDTAAAGKGISTDVPRIAQTRGVCWVLKWAAATATLVSSAAMLVEFGYSLMAEQTLARAARAGAVEATLPRADFLSVERTIWQRLESFDLSTSDVSLWLEQNATPVRGKLTAQEGDRFSVRLAVPTEAVLPNWVRAVTLHKSGSQIVVHAQHQIPGAGLR